MSYTRNIRELEKAPQYDAYADTKVLTMGPVMEVTTMQKKSLGPPIQKIDKDHYFDLRTGEVFEYEHGETRADSTESIRRTLAHIRALVNTNVTEAENCRWVTLTYRENMTDTKRLYEDFRRFWLRFVYWCKKNGHQTPEYITVQEPQGRGAWHVHAFFIWPGKAPYISNDEVMSVLWGHGFTKTKALNDVDNVGAYFSAYLADMPMEDVQKFPPEDIARVVDGCEIVVKEFSNEQDQTKEKRFIKGARLKLYPAGMNIVRKTKGIKPPTVERMTYAEAKRKVSSAKLTFSRSYEVLDDAGDVCNTLTKSYYNSKRK